MRIELKFRCQLIAISIYDGHLPKKVDNGESTVPHTRALVRNRAMAAKLGRRSNWSSATSTIPQV
jgi:hypothetical protein